jgi:hypothetical protein
MASIRRESGLSEVIGFILIIALIAAVASLYLVYVVPAQGRQNEIVHMNQVNNQFDQYKTAIDALIVSSQIDYSLYNTFTLSTQQISSSSGSFYSIPLFQPAGSTGAILINKRTDNLYIQANILQPISGPGNQTPNLNIISSRPAHIYTNFTLLSSYPTSGYNVSYIPQDSGILIIPISNPTWKMWINHTPIVDYVSPSQWNYRTDLTVSIEKNGVATIQELPIKKNIANNTRYYVDLIDDAYGIGSALQYPLVLQRIPTSGYIDLNDPLATSYGYNSNYYQDNNTLGSVEFQSGNNYFIQQNYYYQMGGVFLQQTDGMVNKIAPSIGLSANVDNITKVKINEIIILGDGIIGGTTPIQVETQLTDTIQPVQIPQGIANAKWVAITIQTDPEAAKMWNETFSRIQIGASKYPYNVPISWSEVRGGPASSTFIIDGIDPTNSTYDIELDMNKAYLLTSIERVGIILE